MIEVSGLTKCYGERTAISGLTFSVPRGQIMGFLGPNGAGKSTTMRILTGYIGATSGSASVAGFDVFKQSLEVRRRVGYLPETAPLYEEMRVHSFLDFISKVRRVPPSKRAERIDAAIEACGLEDRQDEVIGRLSRGLRQRVGIAQAIVHEPEVLILDEPTAGLDPAQTRETRDLIRRLGKQHTVVLSSHILSEVEATCERVLIINEGTIVADGTPARLAQRFGSGRSHEIEMTVRGEASAVASVLRGVAGVDEVKVVDSDDEVVTIVVGTSLREVQARTLSLEEVFLEATAADAEA